MSKNNSVVKIIPGRSVSGKDIRSRIKNKTIREGVYTDSDYTTDPEVVAFTKMSRVEQIMNMRESAKKIADMQMQLDENLNRKKKRDEDIRIEREVKARLEKHGKDELNKIGKNDNK